MNFLKMAMFVGSNLPTVVRILGEIRELVNESKRSGSEIKKMVKANTQKKGSYKVIEYLACLVLECK